MKNFLKLIKKREKKPIICFCFVGGEKPPKPSQKNGGRKPGTD